MNECGMVTLTGADDAVRISALARASAGREWVEWAFLYSPSRAGTPRYPSRDYLVEAVDELSGRCPVAVHVCGRGLDELIAEDEVLVEVCERADRVQLNWNPVARPDLLEGIEEVMDVLNTTFIVQVNRRSESLAREVLVPGHENVEVLFDASGGAGVLPEVWPRPWKGVRCGYAGGLSPQNMTEALRGIARTCGGLPGWVDLETGLRSAQERFDLDRAATVIEAVERWRADHLSLEAGIG